MDKKYTTYLPTERTNYKPPKHALESHGKTSGVTKLPSNVEDPIVVNNIANMEFDYTEHVDVDKDLNVNP
ncbi:hypothetical protein [Clostridium septicum]|uniref:Uncharacterized protein n=1 Tax=Clostridium septicum TaxID=1504 RepID=A0A9N7JK12_CLOSE|nr:hypothetical protein [Clostridium septicum]AYE34018.1 hypothetical protein CP523_05825 [Clostridium septicum]MDU1314551.1 hypothetical protein [Clostridium septicum]QAS59390.1 hypothetical protein EI377_00310 [Clostridium septicum]UEC21357.1 hypothetical protein LK444_02995 [Clostridium septicum]USS00598.1 hypothetical protein NH397_14105 [Clostridium septicum]